MMTRKSAPGGFTPARTLIVTSVVGVTVALLLMVVQVASRPAHAASDRLPDLEMAKFKDLRVQRTNEVGGFCASVLYSSTSGPGGSRRAVGAPAPPRTP